MVSYPAPSKSPNLFLLVRYRVTRASGSDLVAKIVGVNMPPTVALLQPKLKCGAR